MTDISRSAPCRLQSVSTGHVLLLNIDYVLPCAPANVESIHDPHADRHDKCGQHEVIIEASIPSISDSAIKSI